MEVPGRREGEAPCSGVAGEWERHMSSAKKRVSIAVGPLFGAHWLTPGAGRFHAAHPDIELLVRQAS
jgi:DNA-binding transcriptional LysR family regulator